MAHGNRGALLLFWLALASPPALADEAAERMKEAEQNLPMLLAMEDAPGDAKTHREGRNLALSMLLSGDPFLRRLSLEMVAQVTDDAKAEVAAILKRQLGQDCPEPRRFAYTSHYGVSDLTCSDGRVWRIDKGTITPKQ